MSLSYSAGQIYSAGELQQGCPTPVSGSFQIAFIFLLAACARLD
jgi:hypothetical protein